LNVYEKSPVTADAAVTITAPRDGLIQKVFANPGQTVASGARRCLKRLICPRCGFCVPVYVGDLRLIDRRQTARVHALNETLGAPARQAPSVLNAPPTANPANDHG
jgi:hypothetical protein